ncbi:TetR/AcrR family transcriptional regulator [Olivibacter sp. SDN3]|uniref:TetR/AcrR family transcriptional regulator n=1 Tax=Olivibacter sp. SDN3 TaxID=2764720 RepID=UPI0016514E6F|nr:TetR/AcrR family transcriptional regulator [Olivibacter sp. SDN3]QNL49857.1 TetR/AcrR family transcriptional regulator [Olivibacter sp. SDN3]
MGIKERKERHKEDLKQRILDAAKVLFLKHGYEATSIRKIASEIEFSPTTIYLYYKDKKDIMYALQKEGFKLLRTRFTALSNVDDPFERLKAMGRTYMQFALENNEFYELMFVMKEPLTYFDDVCGADEEWDDGIDAFNVLVRTIEGCKERGFFKQQQVNVFSMLVWSTMHGLCTLSLHGHMDHVIRHHLVDIVDVEQVTEKTFEGFVHLLEQLK